MLKTSLYFQKQSLCLFLSGFIAMRLISPLIPSRINFINLMLKLNARSNSNLKIEQPNFKKPSFKHLDLRNNFAEVTSTWIYMSIF